MKKLLVAIILLISFNVQAQYITQTGAGYQFKRTKSDSTMLIPTFCGVPTLRGSTVTKQSAIAFDSCNNRLYYYNPKTFVWDIQNPKDTFYILATGQSNSAGRGYTAQADTARDSRVQGWDSVSKAWVTLTVGYSPFYETFVTTATPSPSAQFYFARKLARLRNCIVRVVNFASAGNDVTTITAWHDGVTPQLFLKKIDTLSLQSKVKNYDIVIWDQGESDAAMLDSTYKASFDSIKSYIRKQGYVLPTTPIIVVGMPSLYQNANPFYIHKDSLFRTFDYNNDAYDGYASTDSIPLRSDNLHYNSAGLQRLGENSIWTAWQSLPTNFSSTTFQAKNGLSYKNNAVEIGGILNKNTTIDLGINQLWLKTPTKTNDDSTITGQVIIGDNNFIRKTIFFNNNNPALLINKNKSNNNENVSLLSMTTADVNTKNGWLFQNYSNLSGVVIPNLRTYSPSFDNSYIHDVYTKDNAINGGVTIRVRNYDSLNFSNKVNNEVVNTKLLNIQNGQSLKLAVNSEGKTIIGNGINSIIPTSQLQVVGTGIFTDTLTITTMQNGDSSNRAASTAFVKRNGGAGGGATPIDTSFLRRDINTNTAQIIANAAAIQQRYDSLRRLPGSVQVQGLKSGV